MATRLAGTLGAEGDPGGGGPGHRRADLADDGAVVPRRLGIVPPRLRRDAPARRRGHAGLAAAARQRAGPGWWRGLAPVEGVRAGGDAEPDPVDLNRRRA